MSSMETLPRTTCVWLLPLDRSVARPIGVAAVVWGGRAGGCGSGGVGAALAAGPPLGQFPAASPACIWKEVETPSVSALTSVASVEPDSVWSSAPLRYSR